METTLQYAEVISVEPLGEGTRVCLDFIDNLKPSEGVLVGNTGNGYIIMLAENRTTETYPARPFRVNVGAVHHYTMVDEEKTAYLAELKPGERVMVMSADGKIRKVAIGRIKIEKRPFLRLVVNVNGKEISATVQKADSVHVLGEEGAEKQVLQLQPGDRIMVKTDQPGRHLGEKIEEEITEL
ncbi:3-dehydroquinate synthase II [Gracilibacillus ureilyticus]|uniref:3-dehydroquinate synthase II n=1 Tax=Gracilibacillus ureilyticus TaxID=531814 RepID=A0A1H9SYW1_9BACI|nr:3-dehydroquinate synthase II [Gracilibacillus ureilyticus]SER90210.1 3-dehydroquinate synthase II [Gracilibacillus ureilyticus]